MFVVLDLVITVDMKACIPVVSKISLKDISVEIYCQANSFL